MAVPRLLVVGGNGYLGSAVCKAAVAKGWDVSSMSGCVFVATAFNLVPTAVVSCHLLLFLSAASSAPLPSTPLPLQPALPPSHVPSTNHRSSGRPYRTPAGHTPKWVNHVNWHRASAFEPDTFKELIATKSAVVHSMGVLFEDAEYKNAIARGDILGLVKALGRGATGSGPASNPLKTKEEARWTYEAMNRDSALSVLDTMLSTPSPIAGDRSFVYVSASSSPPMVPDRYVSTKREAEDVILKRCTPENHVHPVIVRPSLMYNAHVRPVTTLPAFAFSLSASLFDHVNIPKPPPGSVLSKLSDAVRQHPLHVDHVADAIVRCIAEGKEGVFDTDMMREWAGFKVVRKEPAAA